MNETVKEIEDRNYDGIVAIVRCRFTAYHSFDITGETEFKFKQITHNFMAIVLLFPVFVNAYIAVAVANPISSYKGKKETLSKYGCCRS